LHVEAKQKQKQRQADTVEGIRVMYGMDEEEN